MSNNQLSKKKTVTPLKDLSIFKIADELSDYIWNLVSKWDYFAKKAVGDKWLNFCDY